MKRIKISVGIWMEIEREAALREIRFTSPYYERYFTLKYLTDRGWKRWILKHLFDFDYEYLIKDLEEKEKQRKLESIKDLNEYLAVKAKQ